MSPYASEMLFFLVFRTPEAKTLCAHARVAYTHIAQTPSFIANATPALAITHALRRATVFTPVSNPGGGYAETRNSFCGTHNAGVEGSSPSLSTTKSMHYAYSN